MMRRLLALLLVVFAAAAFAQLRTIPKDAVRGEIRHLHDMVVAIDGDERRLAPGAQIRDASNRLVLPVAIPPGALVKYVADEAGTVRQVWILTAEEAAQPDKDR